MWGGEDKGFNDKTITSLLTRTLSAEEGLFIKLVEEVGEVAEVLNGRSGRKEGIQDSNEELAKELADIIHYTVTIAAINNIDLTKIIFEKDKKAAIKYQHERDLEEFLDNFQEN